MKTDKEIEEVATKSFNQHHIGQHDLAQDIYEDGFINGYKQAQSEKSTLKELCSKDENLRDEIESLIVKFANTYSYASNEVGYKLWISENI